MDAIKVYAKLDDAGNILDLASSIFLSGTDGWAEIDAGHGDKYVHAQSQYLPGPVCTDEGIPCYWWDGEQVQERTPEDIQADRAALPPPPLSEVERLHQQLATQDAVLQELLFTLIPMMMGGEI